MTPHTSGGSMTVHNSGGSMTATQTASAPGKPLKLALKLGAAFMVAFLLSLGLARLKRPEVSPQPAWMSASLEAAAKAQDWPRLLALITAESQEVPTLIALRQRAEQETQAQTDLAALQAHLVHGRAKAALAQYGTITPGLEAHQEAKDLLIEAAPTLAKSYRHAALEAQATGQEAEAEAIDHETEEHGEAENAPRKQSQHCLYRSEA